MALTERDQGLLAYVAAYGALSTEHILRLCFRSVSRARRRLRMLWQHGFLRRHARLVRMGEGSAALLYTVTSKGHENAAEVNGEQGLPKVMARPSLNEHALRITDFRVALSLSTNRAGYPHLHSWGQGRSYRFLARVKTGDRTKPVLIIPDAFFKVEFGGREFAFFLEIDRGTTDLGRVKAKMLAYWSLWYSKTAHAKLGIRSFRVLHVTTTEQRLQNTLRALQGLASTDVRLDLFSLTCFTRYCIAEPSQLLEPIWQSIDRSGRVLTTCPFPGSYPPTLPVAPGKPPVRDTIPPELANGGSGPGG